MHSIDDDKRFILQSISDERIAFKRHAIQRMLERGIKSDELFEALASGYVIEQYPEDYPFRSCLMLGFSAGERPLHAVVSIDEKELYVWIITVYQPNILDWKNGFAQRRTTG